MLYPGLVSVTFRELAPEEIVGLALEAGLKGIEWGGDVHVPHGDRELAGKVRRLTVEAGLGVVSYGSYYRPGCEGGKIGKAFSDVLETAEALGAPVIRVWAGDKGSDESGEDWRESVVRESRRIASEAAERGIKIAFEYHARTLTDTVDSAVRLLEEIGRPDVYSYWQASAGSGAEERLEEIRRIMPYLVCVHVNNVSGGKIAPLGDAEEDWRRCLREVAGSARDIHAMIEFVSGGRRESFLNDAEVLLRLLAEA